MWIGDEWREHFILYKLVVLPGSLSCNSLSQLSAPVAEIARSMLNVTHLFPLLHVPR